VLGEGGADFHDVGAVGPDGLVEDLAGDSELFRPVGDVGCHLGVDLVRIVRTLHVGTLVGLFFEGNGGCDDVFVGHISSFAVTNSWMPG
jgi:hypothetical protein